MNHEVWVNACLQPSIVEPWTFRNIQTWWSSILYLGMRVNRVAGLKTLFGFGPKISSSVAAQPDGLLVHENFLFSMFPMHAGMRQYWRDMESLLSWTRSDPHRQWWKNFLRNSGAQASGTRPT